MGDTPWVAAACCAALEEVVGDYGWTVVLLALSQVADDEPALLALRRRARLADVLAEAARQLERSEEPDGR